MEKTLNMGAFELLNADEMMETEGGYKFLDDYTPTNKIGGSIFTNFGYWLTH